MAQEASQHGWEHQTNSSSEQLEKKLLAFLSILLYLLTTRWRWSETSQAPSVHCPDDPYQIYEFWSNPSEVISKNGIFNISTPVGGAAPKQSMLPQVMLVKTHTKFGLNMSKH
ncbi:MAG: hypothetical protein ACRC7W_01275 [Fusobacteriaceae bacterium]